MSRSVIAATLALTICAVNGCKRESSGSQDSSTQGEGASKPTASGAVSKPSQLEGRWVRIGPNSDFDGLEFLKDGKLMINDVREPGAGGLTTGGAMTGTYNVLEGGRVSLGMGPQGGAAMIYEASISGDQLQLKETETGTVRRLRRLKSGEDIRGALQAEQKSEINADDDRAAAVA